MLFDAPVLTKAELGVLERIDQLRRQLSYAVNQPLRWSGLLRRSTFARAIQGSNSIEGINVSIEDAIAAVEGEKPSATEVNTWEAIMGYRDAMTYVLQLSTDRYFSYSTALVRALHYMIMKYDLSKHPGNWRPGAIFVRNDLRGEIVYEGPNIESVPKLVDQLIEIINADNSHPIVRAAMGHLNLTMIHPFSDGNGRMARCLQTLILAREGILASEFSSIEEYLGSNTPAYYDVLASVGGGSWQPHRDTSLWLRFVLTAHFRQAETLLRRMRQMGNIYDFLEKELEKRHLPERTIMALIDASSGWKVRNSTYRPAAEVSENLASHDLKLLVSEGFLLPKGERRGRHYVGSPQLMAIRKKFYEPRSQEDPFKEMPKVSPSPTGQQQLF